MKKQLIKTNTPIINKRNIGIIAHVDAGKTTVSERILYFTGKIHKTVEVHEGGARMDGDDREIKHGITINSAATSVHWRDHLINLIDTPGHVDFGIEVKRALRVLDGAVVVFDAVSGVEPQTETNWQLADDFGVSRIAFVNKLDRPGADFNRVVNMMRERLGVIPVAIQMPVIDSDSNALLGIIDLLSQQMIQWTDAEGKHMEYSDIPQHLHEEAQCNRDQLIELLVETDEELLTSYLNGIELEIADLKRCLRKATIDRRLVPVLCGTALNNIGVQPVLDAVVDFLPSPEDRPLPDGVDTEDMVAYAFKTTHNGSFGSQTWLRIYTGEIEAGIRIGNSTRDCKERISRLVRMDSGDEEEIERATAGDIVAAVGMKHTRTGDTLCNRFDSDLVLETLDVPEPVTRVVIEAANREDRDKLGVGLNRLTAEDPTLSMTIDAETGQSILAGMGELHLEMAREKLEVDFDIEINFGRPQVAYRETIRDTTEVTYRHSKQSSGPGQFAEVSIRFEPLSSGQGFEFESKITGGAIPKEYIPGVERGIRRAMEAGTIDGHPVVDVRATLLDGETHPVDSSILAFEFAGFYAFREAMPKASPVLLEPVMKLQVTSPEETLGDVISDLNRRRGLVESQQNLDVRYEVIAKVPLANLFGYINDLRSLSSGRANFSMEFDHYAEKLN